MTLKTILVPTDFSNIATSALEFATKIATKENAKIILLHIYDISYIELEMPVSSAFDELLRIKEESEKILKDLCLKINNSKGIECQFLNIEGLIVETILETIESEKINMVVMGTKGNCVLNGILVKSNTSIIMEKAHCTVVAIPDNTYLNSIKKITFATDYIANDITCLIQIAGIAQILNIGIHIIHISDEDYTNESEKDFMDVFIRKVNKKIDFDEISYQIIRDENIENKIEEYLLKKHTGMFAFSKSKQGIFVDFWHKRMITKFVCNTKIPLITFHEKKETVSAV